MKITLIGGGGVRSPLFTMTLLRWHQRVGVHELCLMDVDEHKLSLFGSLSRELVRRAGDPFVVTTTTDPQSAMTGARHVVTTIRVGFEQGRALDERIALDHGVLGQETTGPGGFAMALRSIPAILHYANILQKVSPGAWMYNFTNPAGLVTQALQDAGYERSIGICDGANSGQNAIAAWEGVNHSRIHAEVFGLNHLSWCRHAWLDGEDLIPVAIADDRFLREAQGLFDPPLVRQVGMHLNEYLYYYYYAEKAIAAIRKERKTRGEEIMELNQRLMTSGGSERGAQLDRLRTFFGYEKRRGQPTCIMLGAMAMLDRQLLFDADIPAEGGRNNAKSFHIGDEQLTPLPILH